MLKLFTILTIILSCLLFSWQAEAAIYGKRFCNDPWVTCIKIKPRQSWESLWPDPYQRDVIKRLNRTNSPLYAGMIIAVPKNPDLTAADIAPFAQQIRSFGMKTIIVSPAILAWGAYTSTGELVKWGPISAGKDYCPDVDRYCRSKTGVHMLYEKRGAGCISTKFPVDEGGGAPMPYCMFYYEGYALHGSPQVPGYHASHGCIRLFTEDARWLNKEFVDVGETKVIVLPYEGTMSSDNSF